MCHPDTMRWLVFAQGGVHRIRILVELGAESRWIEGIRERGRVADMLHRSERALSAVVQPAPFRVMDP